MKKSILVILIVLSVLVACNNGSTDGSTGDSSGSKAVTTLQINNQSTKELENVVFKNVLFIKENADIIGTWEKNDGWDFTLTISDSAWTGTFGYLGSQGNWTRNGNTVNFNSNASAGDVQYC